jgi:16S rRNA (guanine966-N2)-methyltransferase
MRIISGIYKGILIKTPAGIRPTEDRVRKALFDILGDMSGLSFLELYAGSGSVGLEALSQGAQSLTFVEKDNRAEPRTCLVQSAPGRHQSYSIDR